jgi:thiol-disulfide isomerase/thioredoxin
MKIDMEEIKKKTLPVNQYIENINEPLCERFLERKKAYQLNVKNLNKLKRLANNYVVVAFSAEWCKDCAANIPVLALISEATGLEVRIFGGLKRDPLKSNSKMEHSAIASRG